MKQSIQVYSALFLFVFLACCTGQDHSKDAKIQVENNLPDSSFTVGDFTAITAPNAPTRITRNIKQDKEGNLLMASYEGIIRYDGNSFFNITKENGLEHCYAFDVLEDKKGNIWIASDQEGAYRFDGESFTHFTTEDGLAHRRNMCVYEDKSGNIWIGGQGGVSRYDPSASHRAGETSFVNFTTNEGLPHNDVNSIMEDRTGKIWVGTRGHAGVYDPSASPRPDGKKFTKITNDEGVPFFNVWSITEDREGNIWLADTIGLWHYDGNSFTNVSRDIGGLYEDREGNFWSTALPRFLPAVLTRIDAKSLFSEKIKAIDVFKTDGVLLGISEDREGNIWIGGGDGAWCYNGQTVKYYTGK